MRLFIRTEASSQIGMGHFMRCFAIAEEARAQGIAVTFLLNEVGEAVNAQLAQIGAQGMAIAGALGSMADFLALGAVGLTREDWLLIDSYAAAEDYIALQKKATRLAVIDDLNALAHFDCDLLINPAQAARPVDYERKTKARLLLGADYALIRREFLEVGSAGGTAITIMFGGSDPTQLTARCAEAVHAALPDNDIRLIAGPANQHTDDLVRLGQRSDRIQVFASPKRVADVLAGSRLVITAAGGSVGEVAAMGLPALVLVVYDNQAAALKACPFPVIDARKGLPDDLGARVKALIDNPAARTEIAAKAHAVVDGFGPKRIVETMRRV
ncbi:UDP-2,4-diacetamido-2,4,6-trideoxy-beta-L-altropyranose hydrolase [Asticcacaulis taihuensis]|uniref:UDP-2,4-diacetamido-2,4,6-trideoxy-beta-L-altropyranose hydrolase n=1 Tax=Asticcacaulis taihuensis TaxID=260084 RepID=A0A1G4RL55_9CAUL|nr:UDP-2,4-diacetamido-2,4,6-trideoxy-beta-L-altropyranose hydrolase [Asticcacaulis taihuensis]SCW57245.1 UDP-2,4-diacetamido-2,4,6-trideoxy-beta-L-altropyranose hydrolase [Asticcacaulis taihuensis]